MKRRLLFDCCDNKYVIKENDNIVFSINGDDLKFNSLDFYNGIYRKKSASIILENAIADKRDSLKKGSYIFDWLSDIIKSIEEELCNIEGELYYNNEAESLANDEGKIIPLFEMAACAGDGFFNNWDIQKERDVIVNNNKADFAIRILGKSMETAIPDDSIVLVRKTDVVDNGEIGIFVVDGDVMCKRYKEEGKKHFLVPENPSDEFSVIDLEHIEQCKTLGQVIGINKSQGNDP